MALILFTSPSPEGLGEDKVRQDKRDSEANRIAKLIEKNP